MQWRISITKTMTPMRLSLSSALACQLSPHGGLHGHLSWHLALVHLSQGHAEEGLRLFDEAFGADDYQGPLLVKMLDAPSFLWRAELAGHPRDTDRWKGCTISRTGRFQIRASLSSIGTSRSPTL